MEEQGADPVDPAGGVRIVPRHRGVGLLLLEELHDPVHLGAKGVDHPLVLVHHPPDGEDPGQPLEPGKILERVRGVPDTVVRQLKLVP